MKRKRFFTIAIALSTLVAVLAFPLAGCTGEVGFTTASLSKATMCNSVDSETREPVEPTSVFSPDTPEIFCSVSLSNAPSDTEVSSEWIYVEGDLEDVSDYLIDEVMSVGDARFKAKSREIIDERLKNSKVIYVSHSMKTVRSLCDVVVHLDRGRAALYDDVRKGIKAYRSAGGLA